MDKEVMERCCRKAGMTPAERKKVLEYDVFICDGFSLPPHNNFRTVGVGPNEFPNGCYVTIWWAAKGEDNFDVGVPLIFDAFHDSSLDITTKKKARINTAILEATGFLKARKKVQLNG
jgi:hypothetical protein